MITALQIALGVLTSFSLLVFLYSILLPFIPSKVGTLSYVLEFTKNFKHDVDVFVCKSEFDSMWALPYTQKVSGANYHIYFERRDGVNINIYCDEDAKPGTIRVKAVA